MDDREIVQMLVESIEEKNFFYGEKIERLEKRHLEEKRELQLKFDEKERSFKKVCQDSDRHLEAKELLTDDIVKLQEKYEFVWSLLMDGASSEKFEEVTAKIKEFEKEANNGYNSR